MFSIKSLFVIFIVFLLSISIAFSTDYYLNVEEQSHVSSEKGAYVTGWYDPDSSNYFAFATIGVFDESLVNGIMIVKTTDPVNPVIIDTIVTPMALNSCQVRAPDSTK